MQNKREIAYIPRIRRFRHITSIISFYVCMELGTCSWIKYGVKLYKFSLNLYSFIHFHIRFIMITYKIFFSNQNLFYTAKQGKKTSQ